MAPATLTAALPGLVSGGSKAGGGEGRAGIHPGGMGHGPMTMTVRAAVESARDAGLCVLPPREDGTKRPDFATWDEYKSRRPTPAELAGWYANGRTGIGALMGAVSGNVELFEFDDRATFEAYVEAAIGLGLGELIRRISDGLSEETPGGGIHWYYRCAEIAGNTKLARRPLPAEGEARPLWQSLIETRGEGGYAVLAPSHGRVHQTGRPYVRLAGSFAAIATIAPEERAALWQLARSFDQSPPKGDDPRQVRATKAAGDGARPGDDFATRATWDEILAPHGWVRIHSSRGKGYWRRPDKAEGWSATTNYAASDLLYVFSSSTAFEPERGYGKFGAYAVLNHGGDFAAAARDLALRGYGKRQEAPRLAVLGKGGAEAGDIPHEAPAAGGDEQTDPTLPILDAGDRDLARITGRSWEALVAGNDPPRYFRFAGLLARFEHDDGDTPLPRPLTEPRLRHELARIGCWRTLGKKGAQPAHPPMDVVRDMLATPNAPLPILDSITDVPVFAVDGTIRLTRGYHPPSRTYYAPGGTFILPPLAASPPPNAIAAARDLLLDEFVGDFPFVGQSERAHALALLLLPFLRPLIAGPTPLHLIEKPMAGTGGTLLAEMLVYPALGRPPAGLTQSREDEEWGKKITALLKNTPPAILLDNIRGQLESANLARALTSTIWEDRILGSSETGRFPVRCAWVATGNNPTLSSEIARRTVRIRLDAHHARPMLRAGFRHPELPSWAADHRGALVGAALTLVRAWVAAGQPSAPSPPMLGGFEVWARVLSGVLHIAGVPGFLSNLDEFHTETDDDAAMRAAFVGAWWDEFQGRAVGVADLYKIASGGDLDLGLGDKNAQSQRIRLGRRLGEWRGMRFDLDGRLTVSIARGDLLRRAQLWRLAIGTEIV